jgi:alkanesulfonate monooxygenase SsuD/methylene tetrahydromethanopterin reductase-like flavin-dependent oxidoreductase (luciferase family)
VTSFFLRFDFRAAGLAPAARQELFARALDQAAYADEHGIEALALPEHHAFEDGYLPSPLPVAAALAARTRRISISVSALIVNLHDPLRLAEDMAVVDHLSAGRVTYTIGLGYRRQEYELFGRPWASRARDVEERVELLRAAWRGEPVAFAGRAARITPRPFTDPHPFLLYGGGSEAAARRAARLGLGFQPQVSERALRDLYRDECRRLGREPGLVLMPPPGPVAVFCAADPDRFWARYGEYLLADARATHAQHGDLPSFVKDASTTVAGLRAAGRYAVLTPDELVARCRSREIRVVTAHPLCAGLPAEPSWESLRLMAETVRPALARPDEPLAGAGTDPTRSVIP